MALNFDWSLFQRAADAKEKNRRQSLQDLQTIGQNIGGLGEMAKQQIFRAKLADALSQPQMLPVQGPQLPGANQALISPQPGQPGTFQPNPRANVIGILAQMYPEKFAESQFITPLQQSEIAKNFAAADKYRTSGAGGKPVGTIYRNSRTGELTDDPNVASGSDWKAYKTTQGDVLNKLTGQSSIKARTDAMNARTEAWNRSIDNKQIDTLAKSVGLTGKQQSALQQNNLRASRAISILSNPNITWQELALGEIDLAGIMQGGVPTVDEIKDTHFPGWQEKWASWKTYATGHPTENVPDPIRKKVLKLVSDVVAIDNRFIHANTTFQKKMLGPTIRGGIQRFDPAINAMTNTIATDQQKPATEDPMGIL